ncbi:MAG: efflux RND transporter periplasmic adaptor subunit [Thermodesulfobacteriota bacterium]
MFRVLVVAITIPMLCLFAGCAEKRGNKPPPPPIKVGVSRVQTADLELSLRMSGSLSFVANTTVSAEVSAQVKSIEVVDGQAVEHDHVLLVFDETKIEQTANQASATLQKNEATLAFDKTELEKNQVLLRSNSISQTVYDQKLSAYKNSLAQVDADKAVLAKARQDLRKTRVKSPIKGLISQRFVERGDWVSEGGRLFQVSDYTRMYLESFLSDVDVGRLDLKKVVTEGVEASVYVDSYPDRTFKGRLTYVQPVAVEGRLFQIRIYLDNPDMSLLQGMFARGRIVVKTIGGTPLVPLTALLDQIRPNETNSVVIVDGEKKAQIRQITIGPNNQRYAQVLDGLEDGDVVVVRGKEVLTKDQPLETEEMPQPKITFAP